MNKGGTLASASLVRNKTPFQTTGGKNNTAMVDERFFSPKHQQDLIALIFLNSAKGEFWLKVENFQSDKTCKGYYYCYYRY